MPEHSAMSMPLMPSWSVAVAVLVLLAAGALHVVHARSAGGYVRWWHSAHVSMIAGMVVMFLLPQHDASGWYGALAVAFGVHAGAMALALLRVSGVDRRVWAASMVDQLLMVYMLLPLAGRIASLTYLAVAYLVAAAVAWLLVPERFTCMTPPRAVPVRNRPAPHDLAPVTGRAGGATALLTSSTATSTAARRVSARVRSNLTTGVRLTLAVMALAMGWMLLAMQQMPAMPGM